MFLCRFCENGLSANVWNLVKKEHFKFVSPYLLNHTFFYVDHLCLLLMFQNVHFYINLFRANASQQFLLCLVVIQLLLTYSMYRWAEKCFRSKQYFWKELVMNSSQSFCLFNSSCELWPFLRAVSPSLTLSLLNKR